MSKMENSFEIKFKNDHRRPQQTRTHQKISPLRKPEKNQKAKDDKCLFCGDNGYYLGLKSNSIYCSSCAINQLVNHCDLGYLNIKEKKRQTELGLLLASVNREQIRIQKIQQQCQKDKIYQLKIEILNYYQKIKKSVQKALEKDLNLLNKISQEQIKIKRNNFQIIKQYLQVLNKIKIDIQPNYMKIIQNVDEQAYQEYIFTYKHSIAEISQWDLQIIQQQFPVQFQQKKYLQLNQTYTVFSNSNVINNKKGDICFSFSHQI